MPPAPNRGPVRAPSPGLVWPRLSHATPSYQMRKQDAERGSWLFKATASGCARKWAHFSPALLVHSANRSSGHSQWLALCAGLCAGLPAGCSARVQAVTPPSASPGSRGAARGPPRSLLALPLSQVEGKWRSLRCDLPEATQGVAQWG